MPKSKVFGSPALAKAAEKAFGRKAKTFTVAIKHQRAVNRFVQKIEEAHKRAAKSELKFKN